MVRINEDYMKLQGAYLFSEIAARLNKFKGLNPKADIIRLGIGDVTQPLVPEVIKALHSSVDEMAEASTFRGYGPEQGYDFLRELIIKNDYAPRGVHIDIDEIFISDGSKCDTGNIQEIMSVNNIVAVTDPVYPVYVDTNVMAGRTGSFDKEKGQYEGLHYIACTESNGFKPRIPDTRVDIIYLCFPNNPTGTTLTKEELNEWVNYAIKNKSIILYDAAYEAYIQEENVPHSIYEVEGSKKVAIEFRSFSKTAGFTGTRCAFTVVPKELIGYDGEGNEKSLNDLWNRRHTTKFNGVSYIVQKGAATVYSKKGKAQIKDLIDYYMINAGIIRESLINLGIKVFGGVNAPYIWFKCPNNMKSWDFFDELLSQVYIVGTPGVGFGANGEGFFRLTAFGTRENTERAMERIKNLKF